MRHVIKKQMISLLLPGGNRGDAFRIQHELSRHYWQEVLPAMEEVFDASSAEDEVTCIDQLEIDLGRVTIEALTNDTLPPSLLNSIRDQVRIGIQASLSTTGRVRPLSVSIYEHWLFYMRHGYVPWNTFTINEAWYRSVLEALATDQGSVLTLTALLQTDPVLLYRITQQHSDDFLVNLAGILVPHSLVGLPAMINELELLFQQLVSSGKDLQTLGAATSPENSTTVRKFIWRAVFKCIAFRKPGMTTGGIARIIMQQEVSLQNRQQVIQYATTHFTLLLPVVEEWEQQKDTGRKETAEVEAPGNDESQAREEDQQSASEDILFIQQAGAVLLHPFLSRFFTRLGLVGDGDFADQYSKQKALYLVHYLATGFVVAEEHELVIPKVLCCHSLHDPVDTGIPVTQEEQKEADHVLKEAIHQWTVLKNTTIEGLRDGFLRRPGKLARRHDHWRLQVESHAIDVLLDQLPWNLSIIKLPWMKELLKVEWR